MLGGELLLVYDGPVDQAAYGLAAVSQGLEFPDYAVNRLDAEFRVVAQALAVDFVEETDHLVLDAVRDFLILDEFVPVRSEGGFRIGIVDGVLHIAQTLAHDAPEVAHFLLGFGEREFRGGDESRVDIHQLARDLVARLLLDDLADELLYQRDEPDEYTGVDEIEDGVQHGDAVERGLLAASKPDAVYYQADEFKEVREQSHGPDDAEHVEHGVIQIHILIYHKHHHQSH